MWYRQGKGLEMRKEKRGKMKMRKLLSVLLALAMVFSSLGITAFGAEETVTDETSFATAVQNAAAGDTIVLNTDVNSVPTFDKALTIKGGVDGVEINAVIAENFPNIDGTLTFENIIFNQRISTENSSSDQSKLTLKFVNCTFNVADQYAIQGGSTGSDPDDVLGGLVIENCTFTATNEAYVGNYMVFAQCVNNLSVTGTTFDGNGLYKGAVHTGDSTEQATVATISGNEIEAVARGIQIGNRVENSSIAVTNNTFTSVAATDNESKSGAIYVHSNADSNVEVSITENTATKCDKVMYNDGNDDITAIVATYTDNTKDGAATYIDSTGNDTATAPVVVAKIGDAEYATLAEAFAAATDGQTVSVVTSGTYALPSFKDITIKAADGIDVVFDNIGAFNTNGANATFENVTFDYYPNVNYTGLQHAGNLTYNNCTINGQVFLYGASETFNSCRFNQNSKDAYNVWTYGAAAVEFNNCKFNCAGKCVLVYNEGAGATALEVAECEFIATETVEGKAAIEIDTSLMPGNTTITVDDKTTASNFDTGSVSGNSLWNNKKGSEGANNDITVVVANTTVLEPAETADLQIGTAEELKAFRDEVNSGNTYSGKLVVLTADIDLKNEAWTPIGLDGDSTGFAGTFNGKNHTISNLNVDTTEGADNAAGLFGSVRGTLKNFTVSNAVVKNLVTEDPTVDGTAVIAGCTGYSANVMYVHVKNAEVYANRYAAGISGYAAGVFEGCTVENLKVVCTPNEVSEGTYDNGDKAGGIIGYVNSSATTIEDCQLLGTNSITAYRDMGGIAGMANAVTTVKGCEVTGTLTLTVDQTTNSYGEKDANANAIVGRGSDEITTDAEDANDYSKAVVEIKKAPSGSNSPAYTKEVDGYVRVWGEGGGNASESFELKLYSEDILLATTKLNNVDGIIDGDVYVTWNFYYPESNDEYWTTTWEEGHPNSANQPTKVVLIIDGVEVCETVAKMSGADDVNPVVWEELGGVEKVLGGEGTEESPYLINDLDDLIWFRDKVDEQASDGTTQFAGKYFKLTSDIELAGINWNPIGSMSGDHGSFKGVFDGDNHTISNLNTQMDGQGLGLFAHTTGNAEIKNLKLNNVTVKSTNNSNYVGAVVANSFANTKITNVHVTGKIDISGRGYIGGISGHGYVKMDNVSVIGEGTISSTFWCAGGILGYGGEGTTDIKNAVVEGTGTGLLITSAAGGLGAIVGMAEDNEGTQPISGSNLSAKNVDIKTYTGAYGDAYADYALGYLYGGNPTSELTGELVVDDVEFETSTGDTNPQVNDVAAKIGSKLYFTLAEAFAAVKEGETINLIKAQIAEGTIKMPAELKNVTVKSEVGTVLKDMTIQSADGNSLVYEGLTFDGIVFDNSNILLTGWRNNTESYKDWTITNCTFKNVVRETSNQAAVHINIEKQSAINGFTFTNNTIDGVSGGSNSGIYLAATGNITITDNTINNVTFRPVLLQVADCDGIADVITVENNTFSGSSKGRLQIYGSEIENEDGTYTPSGTDSGTLTITENIFTGITSAQQICCWGINTENVTTVINYNYYDISLEENPSKIYFNEAASSAEELLDLGVYPVYTELNEDGTINKDSVYTYVAEPTSKGTFNGGLIDISNPDETFISAEAATLYAKESVVVYLYDENDTLLATTTAADKWLNQELPTLTVKFCINGDSSSWTTVWEKDMPRADYVPAYATLWVDGVEMNSAAIKMETTNGEAAIEWGDVPGVNPAPEEKPEGFLSTAWLVNVPTTTVNGVECYQFGMLAAIDTLNYTEVGFECTLDNYPNTNIEPISTTTVYKKITVDNGTFTAADLGDGMEWIFGHYLWLPAEEEYANTPITFNAYAKDSAGNTFRGTSYTVNNWMTE